MAQLPLRCQRRLSAGHRGTTGARAAVDNAVGQRTHRVVPGPPPRGRGRGAGPVRHGAGAGPQYGDRSPVQPRRAPGRGARAGRPTDGPSARRVDLPPLRRLQLGSRSRGALVRHRAARLRDQGRPVAPCDLQGLRPQHRDVAAPRDEPERRRPEIPWSCWSLRRTTGVRRRRRGPCREWRAPRGPPAR